MEEVFAILHVTTFEGDVISRPMYSEKHLAVNMNAAKIDLQKGLIVEASVDAVSPRANEIAELFNALSK